MRILVVDDSVTMRKIVVNSLGKMGYPDTVEAGNGKEALAVMYSDTIDMVITDWNMPELDGPDFIKAVREDPAFKDIPILMLTTKSMKEDIKQAFEIGATNYIVKPFEPKVLEKKMNEMLNK